MTETLFDKSEEYDEMLNRGLSLSGEDKTYFLAGRVRDLKATLPSGCSPQRILDFGCGIGDSTRYLAEAFPGAVVVGSDTSERAIDHAREAHGSAQVRFCLLGEVEREEAFDLCYVNGVFHHIPPPERLAAARMILRALAPGGRIALFENNPLNPGTRLVMSRVPFDRDAIMLSHFETRRLLRDAGFADLEETRFLFYFPAALRALRGMEPYLVHVPLGGQYYVLARRR